VDLRVLVGFKSHLQVLGRSRRTVEVYSLAVERVLHSLNLDEVADVTPIDLAEWRRRRSAEAKPSTVNLEIGAMRQFFRWAVSYGLIASDPSSGLKQVPMEARLAPRWLDRPSQHRLIRAVQQGIQSASTDERRRKAVRDAAMVAVMLHAGLRVSEVCALDLGDVELSERKGRVTVRSGKRGKRRDVPLNRDARKAVTKWLAVSGADPGHLFAGMAGGHLTTRAVSFLVSAIARRAGVEASPHTLRHTFCHELVERGGVSLDKVALLAGHTTATGLPRIETTLRYTMPGSGELEKAVESIEW